MEDIRFNGKLDYSIENVGFVSLSRDEDYFFEFKTGKERFSFIFVENGELEYYFTETKSTLKIDKGTVCFVPKRVPYKIRYLKDNTNIKIIIFDIVAEKLPVCFASPVVKKSPDSTAVFTSISNQNMRSAAFLASKTYALIHLIENDTFKIPKKYIKIIPAVNEIKQKYFENRKLSYYAELSNMSESNFRKLFKEYTGKSPIEYRNLIRISEVKKMLDSGEFTVSEAAYLMGFNNMSFFYEMYRKYI